MYKRTNDYGIIGNSGSCALVGLDGSIDWCCQPPQRWGSSSFSFQRLILLEAAQGTTQDIRSSSS